MTCDTSQIGGLLAADGSPITFDGLGQHAFKLDFTKIPTVMFFLQGITFPGISVAVGNQLSPHLDFQEIGTKVNYDPLVVNFLVDSEMKNHFEIYSWMKEMVTSTDFKFNLGDAVLTVNNKKMIRFVDVFPTRLNQLEFVANSDQLKYLTCSATFNFDWYEIIPI